MADDHMTPRRFLAKEIRRAREAKAMKQAEVGNELHVSESLVRAWETGRRIPQPDDLERFETFFGTGGLLGRLRGDLVKAPVPLEWFVQWTEIEKRATTLWSFELAVVPGLLQTEDYARTVLHAARHLADTEEMVTARLARQEVLTGEDPPMLVVLLDESVLRRNVGGAAIMHGQLLHLVRMAERENVFIHIIPLNAVACAGFISGFVVASLEGANDVAYVDNQLDGEVIEEPEGVTRLRRMFDTFRSDALSRDESIELMVKVAAEWRP